VKTIGMAAHHAGAALVPFEFERREVRPHDVAFDVKFSGICHSDIHQVNEDWGPSIFPMVPGHEIAGVVSAVGSKVTRFAVGDRIGVGTFVDSCRTCEYCRDGSQQYCVTGATGTYNDHERDGVTIAFGGYCSRFVIDEAYGARISESLDLAGVAPLLCAGITLYSPLRRWGAAPGRRVGIIGLGGLGHMGVKFSHAMGAETTVFSHSPAKREDALRLGADAFVTATDLDGDHGLTGNFDLLINTVSADIDLTPYFELLKVDGTLVIVGLPAQPYSVEAFSLVTKRRALAGSMAGGMRELQEMLDFCAAHGITSDVEVVGADGIATAFARTLASDVRYRFVIDASTFAEP
jgi:alcohol dehydrogenase (NADP+)